MCEDKKSCITINCGCCESSTGGSDIGNMDVLFDGEASVVNKEYALNHSVKDYRMLVLEIGLYAPIAKHWALYDIINVAPQLTDDVIYAKYVHTSASGGRNVLNWIYSTETSLKIIASVMSNDFEKLAIKKIYGFK